MNSGDLSYILIFRRLHKIKLCKLAQRAMHGWCSLLVTVGRDSLKGDLNLNWRDGFGGATTFVCNLKMPRKWTLMHKKIE